MFHETEEFLESGLVYAKIRYFLPKTTRLKVAVAYLTYKGLNELSPCIRTFLKTAQSNKLDFIVGLSRYCITEPEAIDALIRLKTEFPKQVKLGYYCNEGFHPKFFIFESDKITSIILGSSNLTWQGIKTNVEANIAITRSKRSTLVKSVQEYYNRLMDFAANDLEIAYKEYSKMCKSVLKSQSAFENSKSAVKLPRTSLPPQFFKSEEDIRKLLTGRKLVWKIAPGEGGREWDAWLDSEGNGRMAIGWDDEEIGKLTDYGSREALQEFIEKNRKRWGKNWNRKGEKGGQKDPSWYVALQLWRFREAKEGDAVLAYSDRTIYAIGIIDGEYYRTSDPQYFCHRKSVKWLAVPSLRINLDLSKKIGFRQTIYPIKSASTIAEISKLLLRK